MSYRRPRIQQAVNGVHICLSIGLLSSSAAVAVAQSENPDAAVQLLKYSIACPISKTGREPSPGTDTGQKYRDYTMRTITSQVYVGDKDIFKLVRKEGINAHS